jgi:hypothetical protein
MMNKKMAFTALGLGAAYLMRNKDSRDKISKQFESFGSSPMRGFNNKSESRTSPTNGRKKGLLGGLFG